MAKNRRKWSNVPLIPAEPVAAAARVPEPVRVADRMPPRQALGYVVEELAHLDRDRQALLARRDELVAGLHAEGVSWVELAGLAGTSRQALMKRSTAG